MPPSRRYAIDAIGKDREKMLRQIEQKIEQIKNALLKAGPRCGRDR